MIFANTVAVVLAIIAMILSGISVLCLILMFFTQISLSKLKR